MLKNEPPVIVKQNFSYGIDTVWSAITQLEQMRVWFFENIPAFSPIEGFKVQFSIVNNGREFIHLWEIVEVIPHKKIKYNWRYKGYAGNSFVTFELSENDGTTTLELTHEVTEDFNNKIPEFKKENCRAGWQYFINKNLKSYLSGKQ